MDCFVRLVHGGSVRKEDGVFEDMEEELEMFDDPPSFSDLLLRVEQKFVGDFTLKGRFDCGKTRAHYVLVPLRNEVHWLRYTRVIQESNVTMAEVVVENGHRKEDVEDGPSFDGVVGDENQLGVNVDVTPGNVDLDGRLTQEQLYSSPMAVDDSRRVAVGRVNDGFNVGEYERDEEEQEVERIGDVVSSDSESSEDDQGDRDAMPIPVQGRVVRDVPGLTEVEHAGEVRTLMAALVPVRILRSRPRHHRGITPDEGHPLNGGICSKSLVSQKRKKTCVKRKRTTNTDTPPAGSIPELSDEIIRDILVRLSVKSLLRCKSVCKGWRAIVTDPFFVRAHLKRSASKCEQDPCLLITPHTFSRHVDSNNIRFYQWQQGASMATLMHNSDFSSEFRSIHSFAQCDGLVLVPTDTRLYLFNPATRETAALPHSDRNRHQRCLCAGLGLDPRTGNHKVVRAFHRSIAPDTSMRTGMGMEVFTISGNSNGGGSAWREIKDDLPYPAANWTTGMAVNGFLFWKLADKHHDLHCPWGLLRLSLADETFGITRLPDSVRPYGFGLVVLHGELCMSSPICKDTVTMWFLSTHEDGGQGQTWEQRYSVHLSCVYFPLAFLPCGRMMLYTYADCKVCLYDMATGKLTTVCQLNRMKCQGRTADNWKNIFDFNVHLYTESLVRISL